MQNVSMPVLLALLVRLTTALPQRRYRSQNRIVAWKSRYTTYCCFA